MLPLCWRQHPDGQGHPPAAGSRQDLRCAPRGPASGLPPWTRRSRPDGGTAATQRTGRPAGAGPHARLGRTTAPRRDFHHASTLARPWAATHAVPTAHHPRLRIAKRNACSASQSHAERRLRAAGSGLGSSVRRLADQPVLALPGRPHCPAGAGDGGAEATCDTRVAGEVYGKRLRAGSNWETAGKRPVHAGTSKAADALT